MKKTVILSLIVICAAAAPLRAQDTFRYDTIRRASPTVRNNLSAPYTSGSTGSREQILAERPARQAEKKTSHAKPRSPGYWIFGGNFGFGFGDYTAINLAPKVGYRFNRNLSVGLGLSYNYYEHRHWDYTLNYFGMSANVQVYPIEFITLFVQPEMHRRWGRVWGYDDRSELFGSLLVGGGLVIPTGWRGAMTMTIYYDVIQNRYSPHGDNIGYSVGYSFRL